MEGATRAYRLHFMGPDGHIGGPPEIVECEDDRAAVKGTGEFMAQKKRPLLDGSSGYLRPAL
jgi:hypothetical protein